MNKYLIRFDDITSDMDWEKFYAVKKVVENHNIYSVLGVVPKNEDENLKIRPGLSEEEFFVKIRGFKDYGDTIAQHGTYHVYKNKDSGIMGIGNYSEFSGLSYDEQLSKLNIGKEILKKNEVWQPYFMAPSHSFDINTLKALKKLGFEAVTDGYGFYPYQIEDITLVPQLVTMPIRFIPFGVQTICLHTNNMDQASINSLIKFVEQNKKKFINFEEALSIKVPNKYFRYVTYKSSEKLIKLLRKIRKIVA